MRPRFASVLLLLGVAATAACHSKQIPPDVSRLVADFQGADPDRFGRASLELIRLGEPAVPPLAEMLRSADPQLRSRAATTLWGMGDKAHAAVPALIETFSDPDPALRTSVAMALGNIGPTASAAVPALIKALHDPDRQVRQAAVKALGAIGPGAHAALPALSRILRRSSWPEAEEAIQKIRGADRTALGSEPATDSRRD